MSQNHSSRLQSRLAFEGFHGKNPHGGVPVCVRNQPMHIERTIITYSHRVSTCKYIYVFRQGGLVGIGGILLTVLSMVLGMFSEGGLMRVASKVIQYWN